MASFDPQWEVVAVDEVWVQIFALPPTGHGASPFPSPFAS